MPTYDSRTNTGYQRSAKKGPDPRNDQPPQPRINHPYPPYNTEGGGSGGGGVSGGGVGSGGGGGGGGYRTYPKPQYEPPHQQAGAPPSYPPPPNWNPNPSYPPPPPQYYAEPHSRGLHEGQHKNWPRPMAQEPLQYNNPTRPPPPYDPRYGPPPQEGGPNAGGYNPNYPDHQRQMQIEPPELTMHMRPLGGYHPSGSGSGGRLMAGGGGEGSSDYGRVSNNGSWQSEASARPTAFCASGSHESSRPQEFTQTGSIPQPAAGSLNDADCINFTQVDDEEEEEYDPRFKANQTGQPSYGGGEGDVTKQRNLLDLLMRRGSYGRKTGPAQSPLVEGDLQDKIQAVAGIISKIDATAIGQLLTQNQFDIKQTLEAIVDQVINQMAKKNQTSQQLMQQSMAYIQQENVPDANFLNYKPLTLKPLTPLLNQPAHNLKIIQAHGRRKALLIGINYLGTKNELQGCNADVRRIKNLLSKVYGFPDHPATTTILSDDECTDPRMYPTRRNILAACSWLVKNAQAGDVLFFHYSGHGSQKRNLSGTEIDGYDETILPLDYKTAGQIRDDDLFDSLVRPLPAGVKLICCLDCCHSGSGMDLPYFWKGGSRGGWDAEPFPKHSAGDVVLLSSCTDDETAADVEIPGMGSGGALSLGLISALQQDPFNTTFRKLMEELYTFLRDRKYKQKPQLSSTQQFDLSSVRFNFVDILQTM